jgi:hypothetical protein
MTQPDRLAWVSGKPFNSRDGDAWAERLRQLPSLHFVSRDAGNGLDAGIRRVNAERAEQGVSPLEDQDDHFHLLREGTRALRRLQGQASRALDKAEIANLRLVAVNRDPTRRIAATSVRATTSGLRKSRPALTQPCEKTAREVADTDSGP